MNISNSDREIIDELLRYEHRKIAEQLCFIKADLPSLPIDLRDRTIGLIDKLSRSEDDKSRRIALTLSAILWTYKDHAWDGLKDFLMVALSRTGFPPSALMVDEGYDYDQCQFSTLQSLMDQFLITCYSMKYEIELKGRSYLLTEFQKNIWMKLNQCSLLGITAPTSAGKSFIILLKCIELLLTKPGNIVYIVPNLSLVFQVSVDFRKLLNQFGLGDYDILTTYYERGYEEKAIYVLTQEKAIAAFSQRENPFPNIRVLIVDEIQNIERVADEDEQRAKILYDTLVEFRQINKPEKTIVLGPRIENIGNLGSAIFGSPSEEEATSGSPVVNITYAIKEVDSKYYFNQYSELQKGPKSICITNDSIINSHGGVLYTKNVIKYLLHVVERLGSKSINIIFSPTTTQAHKTAKALADSLEEVRPATKTLMQYIAKTIHPKYDLCDVLAKGVAYHHGKLPLHIRRAIEKAIQDKIVSNVVCTTTLMQGVNLPAQNVIIRNPNLYIKKRNGEPKLTNYEIANLRGRAGRLLKDFIGRTFVLDENSFENETEQSELFTESRKEIKAGYEEKFLEFEEKIISDLLDGTPPCEENREYSYLLTYIRQVIIKHMDRGEEHLRMVGIEIGKSEYEKLRNDLNLLRVPTEVCLKNRYWDPLDLDDLYGYSGSLELPVSVSDSRAAQELHDIVQFMKKKFEVYANRYLNVDERMVLPCCINAVQWLKEKPLCEILAAEYYNTSERIDNAIGMFQNKISFGLPMLLKPLYDIKNVESMFLRFIEMGAYRPYTRRMIEMSIPRETSIMLTKKYFNGDAIEAEVKDDYIKSELNRIYSKLEYWDKIQIAAII